MPGIFDSIKKIIFGDKEPEKIFDEGVGKAAKELLFGKGSQTDKPTGVDSGGDVFHDNATHLKMFGGKDVDVISTPNGALLHVSGVASKDKGGFSISMDKQEYARFIALDESHQKKFVNNFLEKNLPNVFKELNNNMIVANYWSKVGDKKFYVPVTAAEYNKMKTLGVQEKDVYFKELLKEKDPQQYNAMRNAEKALSADKRIRDIVPAPWQRDGSPSQRFESQERVTWPNKFNEYKDEPLNPRISKVTPFVDDKTIYLNMTVDGKEKNFTVSNKNTVEAFHAGTLPLNVLANKALSHSENLQANLQNRFDMFMDAQRSQDMSQSQGFHR